MAICAEITTTSSATVSKTDTSTPIFAADSVALAKSPPCLDSPPASAQGSSETRSSAVTEAGKPNAIRTSDGFVAIESIELSGVTAIGLEESAGKSAVSASDANSFSVIMSVPPTDNTRSSNPSGDAPSGAA